MYLVRFVPKDGGFVDEYYYWREEDALYHLHLFDDDAEMYESISILDDSDDKDITK